MSKPAVVITTLEDSASWLDQQLVSAYLRTTYRIQNPPFDLRIGELNKAFDRWLAERQIRKFTFLTAWNPYSQTLPAAENEQRNAQLQQEFQDRGIQFLTGWGVSDTDEWPPEASFCALNLPAEQALQLGRVFQQNALVFGRSGSVPELWWLPKH